MARRSRKSPQTKNVTEDRMVRSLDRLRQYEDFCTNVLPALQRDLSAGMTPEQLRAKYASYLEARKLTVALADPDAGKALTAIKDIQDRLEGKPKERVEHHHKLEKLKDEELDSIVLSMLSETEDGKPVN